MAKPKLALIPAAQGGELFSVLPSSGVGDFDFSRSGKATRINSQGLIEEVGDGVSRLNYPMIDGKVVGCPHHILEPARTNLLPYSEDFSQWTSSLITELPSSEISPKGSLSAYILNGTAAYSSSFIPSISINSGSDYTFSFWVKNATDDGKLSARLLAGSNDVRYIFDINNKTSNPFLSYTSGFVSSNIEEYANGWYRCSLTALSNGTTATIGLYPKYMDKVEENSIDVFGAMLEQGSYSTSYIESNSGSATTRSAETANNSGDASTFNDSEGVLMAEISALANDLTERRISLNDGSTSNVIRLGYNNNSNRILIAVYDGSNQVVLTHTLTDITNNNKFAFKYKQNDYALWVNGIEFGTSTSSFVFPNGTLTNLSFNRGDDNVNNRFYGKTKQIQYYNSALTDSELEQLTSWTSFTDMAQGQLYTIE
jgi:hypothetical protein